MLIYRFDIKYPNNNRGREIINKFDETFNNVIIREQRVIYFDTESCDMARVWGGECHNINLGFARIKNIYPIEGNTKKYAFISYTRGYGTDKRKRITLYKTFSLNELDHGHGYKSVEELMINMTKEHNHDGYYLFFEFNKIITPNIIKRPKRQYLIQKAFYDAGVYVYYNSTFGQVEIYGLFNVNGGELCVPLIKFLDLHQNESSSNYMVQFMQSLGIGDNYSVYPYPSLEGELELNFWQFQNINSF